MLGTRDPDLRKTLFKHCNAERLNALCEMCLNILQGQIPLKSGYKKRLRPYKTTLRLLADKNVSNQIKRSHLEKPQTGGFLPILAALIPAAISAIASVFQK